MTHEEVLEFARAMLAENTAMRNELREKNLVLRLALDINPYGNVENAKVRDEAMRVLKEHGNEPR